MMRAMPCLIVTRSERYSLPETLTSSRTSSRAFSHLEQVPNPLVVGVNVWPSAQDLLRPRDMHVAVRILRNSLRLLSYARSVRERISPMGAVAP